MKYILLKTQDGGIDNERMKQTTVCSYTLNVDNVAGVSLVKVVDTQEDTMFEHATPTAVRKYHPTPKYNLVIRTKTGDTLTIIKDSVSEMRCIMISAALSLVVTDFVDYKALNFEDSIVSIVDDVMDKFNAEKKLLITPVSGNESLTEDQVKSRRVTYLKLKDKALSKFVTVLSEKFQVDKAVITSFLYG